MNHYVQYHNIEAMNYDFDDEDAQDKIAPGWSAEQASVEKLFTGMKSHGLRTLLGIELVVLGLRRQGHPSRHAGVAISMDFFAVRPPHRLTCQLL